MRPLFAIVPLLALLLWFGERTGESPATLSPAPLAAELTPAAATAASTAEARHVGHTTAAHTLEARLPVLGATALSATWRAPR